MKTPVKILIVEDNKMMLAYYRSAFGGKSDLEVLVASTLEEARELYEKNPDTGIVVMDFDLGNGTNTIQLIEDLIKTFKGPMIANSSQELANIKLIRAGCNCYSFSKTDCPEKIFGLISS